MIPRECVSRASVTCRIQLALRNPLKPLLPARRIGSRSDPREKAQRSGHQRVTHGLPDRPALSSRGGRRRLLARPARSTSSRSQYDNQFGHVTPGARTTLILLPFSCSFLGVPTAMLGIARGGALPEQEKPADHPQHRSRVRVIPSPCRAGARQLPSRTTRPGRATRRAQNEAAQVRRPATPVRSRSS